METMRDFILGGSKITADGDRSNEIKKRLWWMGVSGVLFCQELLLGT